MMLVIDDPEILSRICGPNDANLKQLGYLLNSRVLTRGNEILLENDSTDDQELFREIIEQMSDYSRQNQHPGIGYLNSLYESLRKDGSINKEDWKNFSISVPGASRIIHPSNGVQMDYIKAMEQKSMVFSIGPAGTGKTYLAIAAALKALLERKKRKIVLTRPVVEAGESLGFLPGDLTQKLSPYLRPLYDAMEHILPSDILQKLNESNMIELAPLAYMRGRSLQDCFVLLDEAQNTTREQMKMFLTRLGENSQAVITGDVTQIDLPHRNQSGLIHAKTILQDIEDISFIQFTPKQVIRSHLVRQIIKAYETET